MNLHGWCTCTCMYWFYVSRICCNCLHQSDTLPHSPATPNMSSIFTLNWLHSRTLECFQCIDFLHLSPWISPPSSISRVANIMSSCMIFVSVHISIHKKHYICDSEGTTEAISHLRHEAIAASTWWYRHHGPIGADTW